MHSTGLLVPPQEPENRTPEQQALWARINERVAKFLGPEFMATIIPQQASQPVAGASAGEQEQGGGEAAA